MRLPRPLNPGAFTGRRHEASVFPASLPPPCLASRLAFVPLFACAEPKAPSEEENADTAFAASYIGKNYDGDLDVEGWTDLGGGLIAAPIYIHQYQREDGTYLVLTSRQLAKEAKDTPANYEVADALIVPPPQAGVEFTISCVQGKDETLRFIGEAKGPESKEWWSRGPARLGDCARHRQDHTRPRPRASAAPTCPGANRRPA